MDYRILIHEDCRQAIQRYFSTEPFTMRAAFALAELEDRPGERLLRIRDLIRLNDGDYEYRTCDGMSFYSRVLLDILHSTSGSDCSGLVYLHSHERSPARAAKTEDHQMIFRISYAYLPFGVHASLHYAGDALTGRVWLPYIYQTLPAKITYV